MGKTLTICSGFAKFAKVFPYHRSALYGTLPVCTVIYNVVFNCIVDTVNPNIWTAPAIMTLIKMYIDVMVSHQMYM